ncbi:MAG: aminoglycoside phosphotransferase family protein [Chryseolinea sp.]
MIASILSAYGIQFDTSKVEVLVSGLINKTWKVTSGGKSFILQRVNDNVFKRPNDIAQNIRMIDQYLKQHDPKYLFVSQVQNLKGEELVHDSNEGYFRLFPFIEGSHTINVASSPHQAYEAAFQFGKFTRLLSGFDASRLYTTIPNFHNLSLRYQQFDDALKKGNSQRIQQASELIKELKAHHHILETFEKINTGSSIQKRVMHHDTKISNVLFDNHGKGMAIIDLDTVMPGYFISDVGDMMRTYLSPANEEEQDFSKIEVREDFFRAIVNGYVSSMGNELTGEEQGLILYSGSFLIYMQAIRFLADFCNDDSYYGAAYEEHNFVRAGNQMCLLKKLEEKTSFLKNIIQEELKKRTTLMH